VWQQLTDLQIIQKPFVELDLHRVGIEGVLYIWGFHKQFQAETRRTYRPVIASDGSMVGTMFLDRVDYSYLHKRSRFFEIEIESTGESKTAVSELVELLKEQFTEAIVPSAVSKYERGLALVGLQDENKIETKLEIIGNPDDIVDRMHLSGNKLMQRINLKLGWDGRLNISDTYYDTPEPGFGLFRNNCYLRLRSQEGAKPILTFREYHPERDESVSEQIKEEATQESITKAINYLRDKGIDSVSVPRDPLPPEFHDYLIAAGLRISTKIRIDRRVFPVLDREERKIANIKLDQVSFSRHGKAIPYAEIEISSAHRDYLAQVAYIALTLLNEFESQLKAISKPKYVTAQEQLLRNEPSSAPQLGLKGQPIRFRILQDMKLSDSKHEPESREYSKVRIRQVLVDYFSEEELATLAWDLDVDHENLSPKGKSSKARELVALMARTGRLSVLVSHIQQLRPNVNWDRGDE
jgi:hypothetical protein